RRVCPSSTHGVDCLDDHPNLDFGAQHVRYGFGVQPKSDRLLGIVLLAYTVLYLIPRTSVLGAILLTGYLGGAVATHVRVEDGPFSAFFPVIVGALLWGGLFLRDDRLRTLIPVRR
ncbi:MAG: DoxX family protein, partial [Gammaproteobacteria bacterium]